jgi:hypothetical protein
LIADVHPLLSLRGAASSEPDNGLGDGDTANDIQGISGLTLKLRAERSGTGNGRIYTITVTCADAVGNATTSSTTATVPKSPGSRTKASRIAGPDSGLEPVWLCVSERATADRVADHRSWFRRSRACGG